MRATDEDLLAGALALAYKFADLPALRAAFTRIQAEDEPGLVSALEEAGSVTPGRADRLRRGATLLARLRSDAVYGMVAMRNRLVGAQMLNACMEEAKRGGYQKGLDEILLERGVLPPAHHQAIQARAEEVLPGLLAKERELTQVIDLARDTAETAELELAMLLGEVATKVSFLQRPDLESALQAADRAERGLPPEPVAAPPPPPEVEIPIPPLTQTATRAAQSQALAPVDSDARLRRDDSDARIRRDDSDARIRRDDSDARLRRDDSDARLRRDDSDARIRRDDSDARLRRDDSAIAAVNTAVAAATGAYQPPSDSGETDPIKGYELLQKLGQGAMGAVLKAKKRDTGEVVALKILKPELAADKEYVERFLREAEAVERMSHPNIIRAVQAGKSAEYYYFAMEFIEGQTVSELIKAKGALPERFALMVTRCISSALAHAWEHQIVHRDIKPDNAMITKGGVVKLTDLGLARSAGQDSTLTITGVVMGSPAYISPEQATGEKNLDTRSDIYSLGATLFHMLTGQVPYNGETPLHVMLKHMNDPLPDVRKVVPGTSEATRQLVFKMMSKRPEGRFQTPQEVEKAAQSIEEALAKGQKPAIPFVVRAQQPEEEERAAAEKLASSSKKGAAPGRKGPPAPAQKRVNALSQSLSGQSGERPAAREEVGERLKRLANKRKKQR